MADSPLGYYEVPNVLQAACWATISVPTQGQIISFTCEAGKDFNDTTKAVMQSQNAPGVFFDVIFYSYDQTSGASTVEVAKVTTDGTVTQDSFWIILGAPSVTPLLDPIIGPFAHAFLGGL